MRETDAKAAPMARVFVDTRRGAKSDARDLIQAVKKGVFEFSDIHADLAGLVQNNHPGRTSDDEIALFKSVGAACEDLAAAVLAWEWLS
ncbi:MAG: hypothetical protein E2O84_04970 [Bacteroidetes bacterium]|nr:MAG: hypothetical protein E2O84_04970 [Bacteroidota bacterium]